MLKAEMEMAIVTDDNRQWIYARRRDGMIIEMCIVWYRFGAIE